MNDIVRDMVNSYTQTLDGYKVESESLIEEREALRREIIEIGEACQDPSQFYKNMEDAGFQERLMKFLSKAVMAGYEGVNQEGKPEANYDNDTKPEITVKDYVEQYRIPYDEICKAGYRKNAERAYEAIFEVANRTEDMLEAQIILERERLLWNIVTVDALDIFRPILEAMDPLNLAVTSNLILQTEIYEKAVCDEQLTYLLELNELKVMETVNHYTQKMIIASILGKMLLQYTTSKITVYEWKADNYVRDSLTNMSFLRAAMRRLLDFAEKNMGMSIDDIFNDEGMKIWLIVPSNIDELGRFKRTLHPQNYLAYREILDNEILPDISINEILLRVPEHVVWYAEENSSEFDKKAEKAVEKLNAGLTYYKYKDRLSKMYKEKNKGAELKDDTYSGNVGQVKKAFSANSSQMFSSLKSGFGNKTFVASKESAAQENKENIEKNENKPKSRGFGLFKFKR